MADCCLRGFQWEVQPKGNETTLAGRPCYVAGPNDASVAIMIIHDLFGWTFRNTRLLADHYADEVGATVYVPDFFGGEVLPVEVILDHSRWGELDLPNFLQRNSKDARTPEIFECARAMREKHRRIGAIGFCFGGWGVFRLGAKGTELVDCIATAHPTHLTKEEIQVVGVPVQILAPEHDSQLTPELKTFCNATIPTLGVPYDYQFFPGVEHAFAIRGDPANPVERRAMERAKNAAVLWFRQWLCEN